MKEVKIIFVDVLADAGEPDENFFVLTSDGLLYKGNGTASPDYVYSTASPLPFSLAKVIKFANYTCVDLDTVILCDGTFTVTLQTVDSYAGNDLFIKNIGSGTITVDGFSTETIDGSLTQTLAQNESIFIKPIDNTTGWAILSDKSNSGSTPSLQQVTDVGAFTTNSVRTQTEFVVKSTSDVDYLGGFYNVGNSYSELTSSNPANTIFVVLSNTKLRFDNNGFGQSIKPYPTIASTNIFTLPNINADKYIPVTVQINGTPTSANSSGVIDLGTISSADLTYLQTSFTIATGSYKSLPDVQLLSTNRITINGTGRLRINN